MSRLKDMYNSEIVDAMMKKFEYKSVMQIPKLEKITVNVGAGEARDNAKVLEAVMADLTKITGQKPIVTKAKRSVANFKLREGMSIGAKVVINMGVGEAKENAKALESAVNDMQIITGQKAVTTRAKKSVANFKVREGMQIGCKTTLRGEKMYNFLDRLINLALPRVRDFRGVNPNAFDGRGNYALGIREQLIFPEIEYDKIDKVRGMDVIIVTTANTDEEARELLTMFNMPFAKQ